MAHLYAGTSGFAYASWKPDFYPQKLASKDFLKHYATRLNAVEVKVIQGEAARARSPANARSKATMPRVIRCMRFDSMPL